MKLRLDAPAAREDPAAVRCGVLETVALDVCVRIRRRGLPPAVPEQRAVARRDSDESPFALLHGRRHAGLVENGEATDRVRLRALREGVGVRGVAAARAGVGAERAHPARRSHLRPTLGRSVEREQAHLERRSAVERRSVRHDVGVALRVVQDAHALVRAVRRGRVVDGDFPRQRERAAPRRARREVESEHRDDDGAATDEEHRLVGVARRRALAADEARRDERLVAGPDTDAHEAVARHVRRLRLVREQQRLHHITRCSIQPYECALQALLPRVAARDGAGEDDAAVGGLDRKLPVVKAARSDALLPQHLARSVRFHHKNRTLDGLRRVGAVVQPVAGHDETTLRRLHACVRVRLRAVEAVALGPREARRRHECGCHNECEMGR